MPQLNSDEAANDEPKTYNDENGMGQDPERDWHETAELNDLKGDLVGEVDPDPRRPSYDVSYFNILLLVYFQSLLFDRNITRYCTAF